MRLIEKISLNGTYKTFLRLLIQEFRDIQQRLPCSLWILISQLQVLWECHWYLFAKRKQLMVASLGYLYCIFPQTAMCWRLAPWGWIRKFWKVINAFVDGFHGFHGFLCVERGPLDCGTSIFLFLYSFWVLAHKSSYLFYIYSHHGVLTHRRPKALLSLSWKEAVKSWGQQTLYSLYNHLIPSSSSF